ncbi:MAG: FtsX-like permease family protein [Candidatus Neomarinimicrobiota bacterium]
MKFAVLVAKRFMLGGKGSGTSRFTGWIAVIGLAVGCFALIISLAVLNGFEARVTEKIIGFEGDLRISADTATVDIVRLAEDWQSQGLLAGYMPFMERKGLVINDFDENRMVDLKAVDMERALTFYDLGLDSVRDGPAVLVGALLAQRLNLMVGDYLRIMSPIDAPAGIGLPRIVRLPVAGIFRAEVLDFDDRTVFIPLSAGTQLFTRKQGLDGVDLRFLPLSDFEWQRRWIDDLLPAGVHSESWSEMHQGLFSAMRMERIGAVVVLSLIVLVASFNLASTLVLITYQKIREIGILRTMGVPVRGIRNILLVQGLIIGGLGAAAGLVLSLLLVLLQQLTGIIPLPSEIYIIDALPMLLYWHDLAAVPAIAFVLIILASIIASRRAVSIKPKDAVQLEK